MGQGWGDSSGSGVASQGRASKAPKSRLMRFYEARNDKPPLVGSEGLTRLGGSLYAWIASKRDGSLMDCSSLVKHPTTLNARCRENSHRPVGEERGAALKSVQRPPIYGHAARSWEACRRTRKLVKSCQLRVRLRKGHFFRASGLGLGAPICRPGSTTEGSYRGN